MRLSEELMRSVNPLETISDFVVELKPGAEAQGIFPLRVVGHLSMSDLEWREWVREVATPTYGAGYTERMVDEGIDIREITASRSMGRAMRDFTQYKLRFDKQTKWIQAFIEASERYPQLAHEVVLGLRGRRIPLRDFVSRISDMMPQDSSSHSGTLGTVLGPNGAGMPNF